MLLQIIRALLIIAAISLQTNGHTVDQFFMELTPKGQGYKATFYADAAYCLPEYRGDNDKEAPSREWLKERTEAQHARLRDEAEKFVRTSLGFMQDEQPLEYNVYFPDYDIDPYDFYESLLGKAILRIEITGNYLPSGGAFQVNWHDEYRANLLIDITKNGPDGEERSILQVDGEEGGTQMDLGLMIYPFEAGEPTSTELKENKPWLSFVKIGFDHIAGFENFKPIGLDHIIFVIGIFLFSPTWRPLLHQSLTFTISHSITLALSLMGILAFSGKWVEVLIALSIVYIAAENIWIKNKVIQKHRLLIIFLFGLIHGLGFGSVLQEFLPKEDLFLPLVGFNVGVELGQILILVICFFLFGWLQKKFHYIRIGGSIIIALIGSYWVVERIMG